MNNSEVLSDGLGQIAKPLLASVTAAGATLIEAELISVTEGCFVLLDTPAMAAAISADRPCLIFYSQQRFDARSTIGHQILDSGGREHLFDRQNALAPTIAECLEVLPEEFKAREGQVHRLKYAYSSQGLTRYCALDADWYDALVDIIVDFIEGHEERFTSKAATENAKLEALFTTLATEIANDERFIKTRGLRKRGLLVATVWGSRIPKDDQSRLSRLAQGEDPQDWNFVHVVRQASDIVEARQLTQED